MEKYERESHRFNMEEGTHYGGSHSGSAIANDRDRATEPSAWVLLALIS